MAVEQTLTVTQVAGSQNVANNTSKVRIVWISEQTGASYNNYTKTAYYWITTPDGVETKYSVSYTLPLSTAKTILDKTITVTHKDDGTGKVSVRTWMDTGISAGKVEQGPETVTLTTIARDSAITSAANVTLGNKCSIKWTPASASYRYKLEFSLGGWSHTTGAIHPNKTSAYTYTGYIIPLDVADEITNGTSGTMTVTLYTYSDINATDPVGDPSSATFKVTIPSIDSMPSVAMVLTAESSLSGQFDGLYIQGKTKLKAELIASGQYDATIEKYTLTHNGGSYSNTTGVFTCDLPISGENVVIGLVEDSRGNSNYATEVIHVIPYSKPKVLDAEVVRCDANGNEDDSGSYIKITARRSYSLLEADGVQNNFCELRYRYKESDGDYSSWDTILDAGTGSDEVDTGALLGDLDTDVSYVVQVQAVDDVGETSSSTVTVPTAKVYWHRDGARRSFSFGEYVEEGHTFAIASDIKTKAKGPFYALGGGNVETLTRGVKLIASEDEPIDLDDMKTPGVYYSPNADTSLNIANTPYTEGGFGLKIRQLQTADYIRQEIYYGRNTWNRHFDGTSWSKWWRYQTTTVPESATADYVIESDTGDGWTWKKWKGGTYEMFGTFEVTPPASTPHDTLYRTDNMTIDLPFTIDSAIVSGTAVGHYWITNGGISGNSKITLRLMSDREFDTTATIEVRLMVVGTYI